MPKVKPNELEKESITFIGHRKNALIESDIYRREIKTKQSLKERNFQEKTISTKRHKINKAEYENNQIALHKELAEQNYELQREYTKNCRQYRRNLRRIAKKQAEHSL